METIITMIESVSLAVQQPILEYDSSSTGIPEEEASIDLSESDVVDASHPNAASSSIRHSTTSHDHYPGSIDLHYSYRSNLIRPQVHNAPLYEGTFSPVGPSTPPTPTTTPRDSYDNKQTQPLEEVETFCPICLDSLKDTHDISRCRGCVKEFHEDCIVTWLQQRVDTDIYQTCPCW